jgi:hypothetical protein
VICDEVQAAITVPVAEGRVISSTVLLSMFRRVVAIAVPLASLVAACGASGVTPDSGTDGKTDGYVQDAPHDVNPDGDVQDAPPDMNADGFVPDAPPDESADVSHDATDASVEAAIDATDATDTGPDAPSPPAVCGDGLVEPGEKCDVPGRLCVDCHYTMWAQCFGFGLNSDISPCRNLAGAERARCETLLECVVRNDNLSVCGSANLANGGGGDTCPKMFYSPGLTGCFCSDDACTKGADGDCAAAFQAAAGSTDVAEVRRQLVTSGTVLHDVATFMAFAYCNERCFQYYSGFNIFPGGVFGGDSIVLNEVDIDQPGADTREFIEYFNGTGGPYDFSGQDLVLFVQGKRVLTVPLDGIVPNGGYLVVGSAAVTVPANVKKIDVPGTTDVIPNNSVITLLPHGAPDPAQIPTSGYGDSADGSACVIPNGASAGALPCSTPTPGARNVQ